MKVIPTLTFTSSGTWQALASSVDCQGTGEGGFGGAQHSSGGHNYGGGGGGGGEYAEETALALTVLSNYPYTIGPGDSSTNTVLAGDSVTVTAHYGHGGFQQSAGAGGSGSANSIHFNGNSGTPGGEGSFYPSGSGGDAAGPAGAGTGGAGGGPSGAGGAPGGGGGGRGGAGAAGQIVIIYAAGVSGTSTLAGAGTLTAQGGVTSPETPFPAQVSPGVTWLRRFGRGRRMTQPGNQLITVHGAATLAGTGTLTAFGSAPAPAVVNQWSNSYGQGTTFTSVTSGLQSCVDPADPGVLRRPRLGIPGSRELAVRHLLVDAGPGDHQRPRRHRGRHPLVLAGVPGRRARREHPDSHRLHPEHRPRKSATFTSRRTGRSRRSTSWWWRSPGWARGTP